MKIVLFLNFYVVISLSISKTNGGEDIFQDYCQANLCKAGEMHTGCKGGVLHNGQIQKPPCSEDAAMLPLTDADKKDILDYHNNQRNFVACGGLNKEYGLRPSCRTGVMTWDPELEKTAFLHASYCRFDHDKCRNTPKYPHAGQNLGLISFNEKAENNTAYINALTYLWYLEYTSTTMDIIDKFKHSSKKVGHFLAIVNERNSRVGCALVKYYESKIKTHWIMLTCNYAVTNIIGSAIYRGCKKPASKCTTGTDPDYKYLCSSREKYDVAAGSLKPIRYDGSGRGSYSCGKLPELYHFSRVGGSIAKSQHKFMYPNVNIASGGNTSYSVWPWQKISYKNICFLLIAFYVFFFYKNIIT